MPPAADQVHHSHLIILFFQLMLITFLYSFFLKLLAYVFGRIVGAAVDIKQNTAKPPYGTASVEICLLLSRRWSHRGNIGGLSTF